MTYLPVSFISMTEAKDIREWDVRDKYTHTVHVAGLEYSGYLMVSE